MNIPDKALLMLFFSDSANIVLICSTNLSRVHAFGIGSTVDKGWIKRLGEAGKGYHACVEHVKDRTMEVKVMEALASTMNVAASNLRVTWEQTPGVATQVVSERRLAPVIHDGDRRIIYYAVKKRTRVNITSVWNSLLVSC